MYQTHFVRRIKGLRRLFDDVHRAFDIHWTTGQLAFQVVAVDEAHVHIEPTVDFALGVNRDDMRVVQPRRSVCFPPEPLHEGLVSGQVLGKNL